MEYRLDGVVYREIYKTCNKSGCKCKRGEQHGPYWMMVEPGSAPVYVGKKLPTWVHEHTARVTAALPELMKMAENLTHQQQQLEAQVRDKARLIRALYAVKNGDVVSDETLEYLGFPELTKKARVLTDDIDSHANKTAF